MFEELEYEKINHVIIVKTYGRHCIRSVYEKLGYGEHTPNKFSALTLKHKNPSATIILFSTGNITIMGPKSIWGAIYVLQVLKEKLNLKIIHIKLTNLVVKFMHKPTGSKFISDFYNWDKSNCEYDMELFPSCTYMVPNLTIKANFFNSGKTVVTGCNNEKTTHLILRHLVHVIKNFYINKNTIKVIDNKLILESEKKVDEVDEKKFDETKPLIQE